MPEYKPNWRSQWRSMRNCFIFIIKRIYYVVSFEYLFWLVYLSEEPLLLLSSDICEVIKTIKLKVT